jgi:predicted DsbA family dithiol-disulfide isomerase
LLHARHVDRLDLDDASVVERIAGEAGLDLERFRSDVADRSTLDALAADHTAAVHELGVFGTPTFVFDDGSAAYVRLSASALEDGGVEVFDRLVAIAAREPRILEIKRPHRPA